MSIMNESTLSKLRRRYFVRCFRCKLIHVHGWQHTCAKEVPQEVPKDTHRQTAAAVFNVPPELVTSEMRERAKVINRSILYGDKK
jgi:hypothetical protein